MLAAAIRASLIQAGEPDTRQPAGSATTSRQHHQHHAKPGPDCQQPDSLPASQSATTTPCPASSLDPSLHSQQQQLQGWDVLNGHGMHQGKSPTPAFSDGAWEFGGTASMQNTASSTFTGQSSLQQASEQTRLQQGPGQSAGEREIQSPWSAALHSHDTQPPSATGTPADGELQTRSVVLACNLPSHVLLQCRLRLVLP